MGRAGSICDSYVPLLRLATVVAVQLPTTTNKSLCCIGRGTAYWSASLFTEVGLRRMED